MHYLFLPQHIVSPDAAGGGPAGSDGPRRAVQVSRALGGWASCGLILAEAGPDRVHPSNIYPRNIVYTTPSLLLRECRPLSVVFGGL